jgi:mannose-1-phosphate guanylyltransferase
MYEAFASGDEVQAIYEACESISIDYGVLEKADNVRVIPSDFGWSDLGTWTSLANHVDADASGNGAVGAEVLATDSKGNIVVASRGKTIAIKGLDNFIVVDTDDALLICPKSDEQWVKELVGQLKDKK